MKIIFYFIGLKEVDLSVLIKELDESDAGVEDTILNVWNDSHTHRWSSSYEKKTGLQIIDSFQVLKSRLAVKLVSIANINIFFVTLCKMRFYTLFECVKCYFIVHLKKIMFLQLGN